MDTLRFNTTTKNVTLLSEQSQILKTFDNVSTVKCSELGFYEVFQRPSPEASSSLPVFRAPTANTYMSIEH